MVGDLENNTSVDSMNDDPVTRKTAKDVLHNFNLDISACSNEQSCLDTLIVSSINALIVQQYYLFSGCTSFADA